MSSLTPSSSSQSLSSAHVKTLHSFDTEYSADSIEWCTAAGHRAYFVCGTYQLLKDETGADAGIGPAAAGTNCQRTGRIYLFHFDRASHELQELQRLDTAAILDMRWLPPIEGASDLPPTLAIATAEGKVELYALHGKRLTRTDASLHLNEAAASSLSSSNLLALSLDCQPDGKQLLCSDSHGGLHLLTLGGASATLHLVHAWPQAHSFEAWICAFDRWDANRVYSGGDDCLLRAYDLRTQERCLTNKSHQAGVTCLLSHPRRPHALLTGSYDECVRVFDTRAMRQPVNELNVGGGVWRLKAHPLADNLVLAACMYNNFSVLHAAADETLTLAAAYEAHESICYGADWCMDARPGDVTSYFATCSFYDHKMCVASYVHSTTDQ